MGYFAILGIMLIVLGLVIIKLFPWIIGAVVVLAAFLFWLYMR
jgi:hypothetical protein